MTNTITFALKVRRAITACAFVTLVALTAAQSPTVMEFEAPQGGSSEGAYIAP